MLDKELFEKISPLMNHIYMQHKWFDANFKPICKEHGLKFTDISILLSLHLNPEIQTAKDIEKYSELKRGNISICVEKLSCMGFLKQEAIENDRRMKKLVLTKKSGLVLEKCDDLINKYVNAIFKDVSEEDCELLNATFAKMMKNQTELYNSLEVK